MTSLILLIDDDTAIRTVLRRILESEGFLVELAENGKKGLELLKRISPKVIVTDLIMPEKEGIEMIVEMRKAGHKCKIIAMSGGGRIGNTDFLSIAKKFGADDVLAKPFDPDDLIAKVREYTRAA